MRSLRSASLSSHVSLTRPVLSCVLEEAFRWGKEVQCGWLKEKFGLFWQIVPTILGELMSGKDAAKSRRVMEAMLKMVKLDIKKLKRAAHGKK